MLRILIVEDDREKLQRVSQAILAVDSTLVGQLDSVTDVRSARLRLQEVRYDLLILDVMLPMRVDEPPRADAGLQLLDELARRDGKYHIPGHTIGITQHEGLYDAAQARFQEHTLSVVRYDALSDHWIQALQGGIRYVLRATESRLNGQVEHRSEAAIVCALTRPELAAVRSLPWDFQPHHVGGDDTPYYRGVISRDGGGRIVYAAAAARAGMQPTAVLATKMVAHFRPKYLVIAGICAGVRGRTHPGDLVVADPCWDWGSGKWAVRDGEIVFLPAYHQIGLTPFFRGLIQEMMCDEPTLSGIQASWQGEPTPTRLALHLGPAASGAAVVAAEGKLTEIVEQHQKLIGIEMEAYSIYLAAEEAPAPRPLALSLKSVVDHADAQKGDHWQHYGAYVSARAVQHVLEHLVP